MSAYLEMTINVTKGGDEAISAIIMAICEQEGCEYSEDLRNLLTSGNEITVSNVEFLNIWGDNYLEPDSSLYEAIAKAIPEAEWNANSHRTYEGDGEGCEAEDSASYKDHLLSYSSLSSFDSITFETLCDTMLEPWGDIEENIEELRNRENKFYIDGTLRNQCGITKPIKSWILENNFEILDKLPETAEESVVVISDKKASETARIAKDIGIPVISSADFIVLFVGYYEFEEVTEAAELNFNSSTLYDNYKRHVTFDAVKLAFSVDASLTEIEFEELRKKSDYAEMELQGDALAMSLGLPREKEVIKI